MDETMMRRVRDAVKKPHRLAMVVVMALVLWALAMESLWAVPLALIAGSMAGERDAARRVLAALAKGDER